MRSDIDEVATMCGLDVHDERRSSTRAVACSSAIFGSHPRGAPAGYRALQRDLRVRAPGRRRPTSRSAASSRPPTTSSSIRAGAACRRTSCSRTAARSSTASPSPGVSTAIGDFPGLALMDLMKPYMPPTPENYQRVLKDIHARAIQMWAGCIWVPIYEVMTRKHLKLVTLEENLEMAADIGMDATTSLDEAFAEAMERHGSRRQGAGAAVRALPAAAQHVRMEADPLRLPQEVRSHRPSSPIRGVGAARGADIAASAAWTRSVARPRSSSCCACSPTARAARSCRTIPLPCAHCGGAFHEPLTLAAKRHKRDPRAVLDAFRALRQRPVTAWGSGRRPRSRPSHRARRAARPRRACSPAGHRRRPPAAPG